MITLSKDSHTDLGTNEKVESVYLRLYLSAFRSGLVKQLKPTNFTVLMTICSFMNEDGECFPTQEQIAELSGISKPTVNKAINTLLEFEFNGKPLISREIVQKGYFKNSVYKVNPITQVAIFGGEVENVSTEVSTKTDTDTKTGMKAADIIDLFFKTYVETYNSRPSMNYGVVTKLLKNKWVDKYSDEAITKMVVTSVKEYDARWKAPKYQRPTLPAIVSWIGEQALGLSINQEKDFKEVSEMTSDYVEVNDKALNRLANRLQK